MDAERFDDLTKAMASGATRRRALRLAGGGLAGALLAAVGVSRRAGAEHGPQEGEGRPEFTYCSHGHAGPDFNTEEDPWVSDGKPCGGGPNDCPHGSICIALVNPVGHLGCRCVKLESLTPRE